MTEPKITTFRRGSSRWYRNPLTGDEYVGVTSITGKFPKEWLGAWNAKLTAEFAVENIGSLFQMILDAEKAPNPEAARKAVVDHLKGAPRRYTSAAADTGSDVHALIDRIIKGEDPASMRIHPDHRGYVDSFLAFVEKYEPEWLFSEVTCFSDAHGYAGTLDGLARIDGKTVVTDVKTGRSYYPETAGQIALYAAAEYLLELVDPKPSLTEITEPTIRSIPMPKIDGGIILHIRPTPAESSVIPVDIGPEVVDTALALLHLVRWDGELKKRVLGEPLRLA